MLVGGAGLRGAGAVVPSNTFEIDNAGLEEINFMLMIRRDGADGMGHHGGSKLRGERGELLADKRGGLGGVRERERESVREVVAAEGSKAKGTAAAAAAAASAAVGAAAAMRPRPPAAGASARKRGGGCSARRRRRAAGRPRVCASETRRAAAAPAPRRRR